MQVSIVAMSPGSNGVEVPSRVSVTTPWTGARTGNGRIASPRSPNRST